MIWSESVKKVCRSVLVLSAALSILLCGCGGSSSGEQKSSMKASFILPDMDDSDDWDESFDDEYDYEDYDDEYDDEYEEDEEISEDEIYEILDEEFDEWAEDVYNKYYDAWKSRTLKINGNTMPLYWRYDESKVPEDGRALFISLHGGGGAAPEVNDGQWENQKVLYNPRPEDVYLCPRAAFNTWDLHFCNDADAFYSAIIQMAVVFMDVNPNKVYILGYSAGGDGVWRLAPRHADYWAAASMMAGHPGDVSLLNLRNTPFMIWCGSEDSDYNRNLECKKRIDEMARLHADDSDGYIYYGNIVKGKGHWMDGVDAAAIDWMYQYTRDPYPERVVWNQEEMLFPSFYWLKVPKKEMQRNKKIVAEYDGNTVSIEHCDYRHLTILLNDDMMDLDEPVTVKYRGKKVFSGMVSRSADLARQNLYERNDPSFAFYAQIELDLSK